MNNEMGGKGRGCKERSVGVVLCRVNRVLEHESETEMQRTVT